MTTAIPTGFSADEEAPMAMFGVGPLERDTSCGLGATMATGPWLLGPDGRVPAGALGPVVVDHVPA